MPFPGPHYSRWEEINIYTDSCYAFATLHIHGATYKQRGKEIKTSQKILQLSEAVWKPQAITVVHCPAHTNQPDKINQGNGLVDRTSKEAALLIEVQKEDAISAKICFTLSVLLDWSSTQEENRPIKQGLKKTHPRGNDPNTRKGSCEGLVRLAHDTTHLSKTAYNDCYKNIWSFLDWRH
jgi:hypothetical protein